MQIQLNASHREWGLQSKYARAYSLHSFIKISIVHAKPSEKTRICLIVSTINCGDIFSLKFKLYKMISIVILNHFIRLGMNMIKLTTSSC